MKRSRHKAVYSGLGAEELKAFTDHIRRRKYSEKTVDTRQRAIVDLLKYLSSMGRERLADVERSDLNGYRENIVSRNFNVNSVNGYLWSVKRFFDFLEETQLIFENPAAELQIPAENRRMQPVPSEGEMKQLLSAPDVMTSVGKRDRAILEVMYSTAVRRGELVAMKIFDPDFDRGCIRVNGKGNKERVVPLGKHALYWLQTYLRDARPRLVKDQVDVQAMWVSKDGGVLSGVRVDMMIRECVKKVGITKSFSAHSLRRACVTHMLMHGAHPVQLQMLLGHASLKTLSQYLQLGIKDLMKTYSKTRPGK